MDGCEETRGEDKDQPKQKSTGHRPVPHIQNEKKKKNNNNKK